MTKLKVLISLCAFMLTLDSGDSAGEDSVVLAKKWAPKIYLNSHEEFWPGDVEAFLKQVSPEGKECKPKNGIPTGKESQNCYLTTKGKPYDMLKDKNSFLYGVKPSPSKPVPAYAFVQQCGSPDHIILKYWIFFPFNKGKDMCSAIKETPILSSTMSCGNSKSVVGNHIGDWEHLSVELKGGQPVSLFLSVHDGGLYYKYDQKSNSFVVSSDLKEGILKVPHPPETVALADGHPVLYSAEGSHAVWAAEGKFSYSRVEMSELVDVTDKGTEWDTWKALQVFHSKETTPAWWYYDGHWGNQGSECILNMYCIFSDGPKGLSSRPEEYKC